MTAQQLKEQSQKTGGTDQIFVPQEDEGFAKRLKEIAKSYSFRKQIFKS